ncbi:putative amidase C550.07 [Aspergillus udagawae]|uniref:amidase n=1 Tax=Aspergillus udagawae TaxID=91492 RepID=A0ABQ1B3Q0_9EURO|nr:putative amidase C550.07 [Aspergillus udagawae]GFF93158.1 putative amidase C550.07 [Aspergillus udagawae]GFG26212.1 putative amidase C550.07 [Aspergillus udagawae]
MTPLSEPAYLEIARRKQAQLDSGIPTEWRLPAHLIPAGMLFPPSPVAHSQAYRRENVMDIPRRSGLLTQKELRITENWDVRGLLAQMREGTCSAEDVARAFSKRAAIAHQVTRCLTEPLFPSAIQRAQHLDVILQRTGKPVGPLHGLPVSVKDCFRIRGVDSCIGLTALAFKPSTFHARLVNMLLSLGAVIIAKTNVSQAMAAPDSYNHVFGRTLNPLNHQLTVGGSSGGEAALVAMRGSMVGFGTDIGGSIRVPAMCTGLYGFKPSVGRIPFGGVVTGQTPGLGRVSLQGVAGPLARSVADLGTVLAEIVPRAEQFGEDCIPGRWVSESPPVSDRQTREFTVGVLRTDGLVTPLPSVARVLDEVADSLRRTPGVRVVDVPVPPALRKCQGIAGRLMGADGGGSLLDLLESTSEPLIPWLQTRMKRREPLSLEQLVHLQDQRSELEKELHGMWTVDGECTKRIDAIITPVAPHPVPELDRFNAIGYTASFVLLDYPAGTIPVRNFLESDLDSGSDINSPVLGSWDRVNRELWRGKSVDRRVYLDSPLSIQVVTPRQHDYKLFKAMEIIDQAVQSQKRATWSDSKS